LAGCVPSVAGWRDAHLPVSLSDTVLAAFDISEHVVTIVSPELSAIHDTAKVLDILTTAPYAAAKAGIMMFSRHVAKEVGPYGVRVNCIAPATVLSDRIRTLMSEDRLAELAALSPLGRMGIPQDVALATLFLASDSSSWLTGVTLDVAGGRIML